jgi:hypothetical protein
MAEGLSHLERMSRDGRVAKLQRDGVVEWVRA